MKKMIPLLISLLIPILMVVIAVYRSRSQSSQNSNRFCSDRSNEKLCKSQDNRIISGVCGGIAEHFGWNAGVVRFVFLLSGVGLLPYTILAIVLPDDHCI